MVTMTNWIVALVAVPLSIGYIVPLLHRSRLHPPTILFWPLSVVLGLGIFTSIFTVVSFYDMTNTRVWIIFASLWTISAIIGQWSQQRFFHLRWWKNISGKYQELMVGAGIAIVFVVIIAQATYYPFTGDDEISRYAYFARLLFEQGELTHTIRGYPPMLPTLYASNFFASSSIIEQVAKLYPVIFSAMTVWVTYGLARYWFSKKAAYAAALILSSTPLFVHWSPVGYVDIATGLCFGVCAFTIEIWRRKQQINWAIVTGMVFGVCLWTKQAGFAAIGPLLIICGQVVLKTYRSGQKQYSYYLLFQTVFIFVTALFMGGWWYIRNAYYDGWNLAIPSAGLYHVIHANNTPEHIVPFVGNFLEFGLATSPLYIAGLIWALCALRNHTLQRILLWCLPFTLLWWWRFSFDQRFLISVLPFYAVLAGGAFDVISSRISFTISSKLSSVILGSTILVIISIGLAQSRLGGIMQWATNPEASYSERISRAKGDLYPTVKYLLDNTSAKTLIYSTDGRIKYYMIDYPISVGYPKMDDLQNYDLFVVGSRAKSVYDTLFQKHSNPLEYLEDSTKFRILYTGPHKKIAVYKLLKD